MAYAVLAGLPTAANALGLGKLTVSSALDEPLQAEIALTAVGDADVRDVEAALGSRSDFQRAGVDRPGHLDVLEFEVTTATDGSPVVKVSSTQPMVEPFLHFLIAVEWAGGRVMREYTALLDPPLYAQGDAGAISSPKVPSGVATTADVVTSAPDAIAAAPEVAAPTTPSEVAEEPVPPAAAAPTSFVGGYDLEATRRGDTLWSIAEKVQLPPGANIYQLMIAMLNANPDAFIDGNLNRLKTGQILRVPAAAEIESLSRQSAVREYQAQLADWESFRARAAGVTQVAKVEATAEPPEATVAPTEPAVDAEPAAPAAPAASAASTEEAAAEAGAEQAGEPASEGAPMAVDAGEAATAEAPAEQPTVVAEAADAEQPAAELEQDLLRIVRATLDTQQGEATAASEGVAEQAEAGQAPAAEGEETSAASVDADMRRLEAKLATLEESLLSRDLENRELREQVRLLEEQVRKTTELLEIESQNLALAQQAAAQRVAQAADRAVDAEPAAPQAATVAEAEVAQTEAPATASEEAAAAGTPRRIRQSSAQDWWKRWLDNAAFNWQLIVLGVLGVAVAATGALLFVRRRRSMAQFEESILSGSALSVQSSSTDNTATSATDTSFLSDFGVPGMGTMQADEVDPLAEAEVYIAYGRDEQAEEVLKEAIARDASREELKVKLLEIYHKRNDVNAFEMLAEELYPAQGEQTSAAWARVAAMGRKLSPQNPLFKSVPADAAAGAAVAAGAVGVAAGAVDEADEADSMLPTGSLDPRDNPFPDPMHSSTLSDDDAFASGEAESDSAEPVALEPFPEPDRAQFPDFDEIKRRDRGEAAEMSAEPADVADAQGEDGGQEAGSDAGGESLDSLESIEGFADLQGFDFEGDEERAEAAGSAGDADRADQEDSELLELDLAFEDAPEAEAVIEADQEGELAVQDEPTVAAVLEEDSIAAVDVEPLELTDDELFGDLGDDDSGAGGNQPETAPTWDEAATKLDLAKAYLDMGDKSGARNILDEVLRDGNDGQRQQAAELAAQLAS